MPFKQAGGCNFRWGDPGHADSFYALQTGWWLQRSIWTPKAPSVMFLCPSNRQVAYKRQEPSAKRQAGRQRAFNQWRPKKPRELASLWARRAARRHLQKALKKPFTECPSNRQVVATQKLRGTGTGHLVSMPFKQAGGCNATSVTILPGSEKFLCPSNRQVVATKGNEVNRRNFWVSMPFKQAGIEAYRRWVFLMPLYVSIPFCRVCFFLFYPARSFVASPMASRMLARPGAHFVRGESLVE